MTRLAGLSLQALAVLLALAFACATGVTWAQTDRATKPAMRASAPVNKPTTPSIAPPEVERTDSGGIGVDEAPADKPPARNRRVAAPEESSTWELWAAITALFLMLVGAVGAGVWQLQRLRRELDGLVRTDNGLVDQSEDLLSKLARQERDLLRLDQQVQNLDQEIGRHGEEIASWQRRSTAVIASTQMKAQAGVVGQLFPDARVTSDFDPLPRPTFEQPERPVPQGQLRLKTAGTTTALALSILQRIRLLQSAAGEVLAEMHCEDSDSFTRAVRDRVPPEVARQMSRVKLSGHDATAQLAASFTRPDFISVVEPGSNSLLLPNPNVGYAHSYSKFYTGDGSAAWPNFKRPAHCTVDADGTATLISPGEFG